MWAEEATLSEAQRATGRMEQAVIIEQNTKTPGPATIVTEQGVFLYLPTGPGYGVIVPLEGKQGPSRATLGGSPPPYSAPDRWREEGEYASDSPEEPASDQ